MYWELFNPGQAESQTPQPLPHFPEGLLYGYGIYTTLKMPCSEQVIDWHLQRLKKDCKAMGLSWRYKDHWIMKQLKTLFQAEKPVFRLSVCADLEGYSAFYTSETALPSRLFLSSRPASPTPQKGLHLKTVAHQRSMPTIKHTAMAETILQKRQAQQAGFDDILLMNGQGHACETSTANIFLIKKMSLITPEPVRDGCLPGIIRQQVLTGAQNQQILMDTDPITLETLKASDGAFLSNAVQGLVAIQSINKHSLPWPDEAKRLLTALSHTVSA
jgi:branched-subunit amino acid aminotransferase/4-amino-4-deoxychorismate lyase